MEPRESPIIPHSIVGFNEQSNDDYEKFEENIESPPNQKLQEFKAYNIQEDKIYNQQKDKSYNPQKDKIYNQQKDKSHNIQEDKINNQQNDKSYNLQKEKLNNKQQKDKLYNLKAKPNIEINLVNITIQHPLLDNSQNLKPKEQNVYNERINDIDNVYDIDNYNYTKFDNQNALNDNNNNNIERKVKKENQAFLGFKKLTDKLQYFHHFFKNFNPIKFNLENFDGCSFPIENAKKNLIINYIGSMINLAIFLIIFVDYDDFSLRLIISPIIFFITCAITGVLFLITKCLQFKNFAYNNKQFFPVFFLIEIFVFKNIFVYGIWSSLNIITFKSYKYYYDNEFLKLLAKIYLMYFIFTIYYYTIISAMSRNNKFNIFCFILIGIVCAFVASFIIFFFSLEASIFTLIVCLAESFLLTIGICIALCRDVLDSNYASWNALNIEIYKLYGIFIIISFPGIIILVILFLLSYAFCRG